MSPPLWQPRATQIQQSNLTAFIAHVRKHWGVRVDCYQNLYQWSIDQPEAFWQSVWDFTGIIAQTRGEVVLEHAEQMQQACFFPGARLNYAENLLRRQGDDIALVFWGESKVRRSLTFNELKNQVAKIAASLRYQGIKPGDQIAGFVPNTPEALIAMLATASIGAIWSSCSPDFGVQGTLDRLAQIEPKVLFSADGYFYNGKLFNSLEKLEPIVAKLPSLERVVVFPYAETGDSLDSIPHATTWDEFQAGIDSPALVFEQVPFNHPLFIMFSSGTTGKPKCIVHSVGGTLIEHLKEHQLHCDIKTGDRVFYFTTCGWMMWNWQVSALASGATLLLYDGSPVYPNADVLFDYAEQERMTLFGTAAKFIDAIAKAGVKPQQTHQLDSLKMITSTGSPLVAEAFDYVYQDIKADVCLASISGGSDILGCFVLGNPTAPVWRGEIQARSLGLKVEVFDDQANSVTQQKGELVCTGPFPSMPIGFWNDPQNTRYHDAYFSRFDNVWHHGDFVELTEHDGMIIYGRSDAVLNPGGVRIGTAEIYRQVEQFEQVLESIAVGQEWQDDVRVILFVKLRADVTLDEDLITELKQKIRTGATSRHVPAKIIAVADIPRTRSGKIVEIAVRDVIHGRKVNNTEALANPEALAYFKDLQELQYQ
ncbi:MAG: acetoacetate--CoA ligase [Pseudomonadota bacterium]